MGLDLALIWQIKTSLGRSIPAGDDLKKDPEAGTSLAEEVAVPICLKSFIFHRLLDCKKSGSP